MAKARLKMPASSLIAKEIGSLVEDLDAGPIEASLLVDRGHDYWWFLEFGTGTGFVAPETDSPFIQPLSTRGYTAEGDYYGIDPLPSNTTGTLVYKDVNGFTRKRGGGREITTGRFKRVWNRRWQWMMAGSVEHPGIMPEAYFRQALNRIELRTYRQLDKLAQKDELPEREDIVDIVNDELGRALYEIKGVLKETESLRNWPRKNGRLWKALSIDPAE